MTFPPGYRPDPWGTAGDHDRRIRALEAVAQGSDPDVPTFPDAIAELASLRSLVGYWRLGEPSGVFADTSGHIAAHDATAAGAMTRHVTGALPAAEDDGAVDFLGTGSADIGADNLFQLAGDMSVSAWVNLNSGGTRYPGIVSRGAYFPTMNGWALSVDSATLQPIWRREDGAVVSRLFGPVMAAGTWHFLVGTNNSTTGMSFYVDGVLVATDANLVATMPTTIHAYIGTGPYIGATGFFDSVNGVVDEVSIWADELTVEDVALLTEAGGVATSTDAQAITAYGNYTLTASDDFVLADLGATLTITLPVVSTVPAGKRYTVKKGSSGTGTITVARNGATIDNVAANVSITTANQAREFTSDGSGWRISAGYL